MRVVSTRLPRARSASDSRLFPTNARQGSATAHPSTSLTSQVGTHLLLGTGLRNLSLQHCVLKHRRQLSRCANISRRQYYCEKYKATPKHTYTHQTWAECRKAKARGHRCVGAAPEKTARGTSSFLGLRRGPETVPCARQSFRRIIDHVLLCLLSVPQPPSDRQDSNEGEHEGTSKRGQLCLFTWWQNT